MTFRCRFAPSPNGRLHLGHAYSALVNHHAAARAGGAFLLRIEDIDATRSRPDFVAGIREDLAWLGVLPPEPPRFQSAHLPAYAAALAHLEATGLVYPAFESRAEIAQEVSRREHEAPWPRDPDGAPLYPFSRASLSDAAREKRRADGAPHVLRLHMAAALENVGPNLSWREAPDDPLAPPVEVAADPAAWGDVILARRDVPGSYHLCVVIDDAEQEISHVIRGADLRASTAVHLVLQRLLGLPAPTYHHHRLILDGDGRKMSKSVGSQSLAALRQSGADARTVRARLGFG